MLIVRLVLAAAVLSLAGSAATCAWAAARLAIAVAEAPAPRPPADRAALVILRGDTGRAPAEAGLGRGGPPAGVRPQRPRHSSSRVWCR